jgi:anti-sigma-K factor RskA
MSDHERWEELVAGHALNALEPAEEAEVVAHLEQCAHCQEVLADHAFVAAQLGTLVDDHEAPSWDRIRTGVLPARPAQVSSLEQARRRRRAPVWLSAAAAAALVAGGGALLLHGSGGGAGGQQQVLAACRASTSCHLVRLQDAATLVVQDGKARMLPTHMPAAPAGTVYVLWQLPRDGRPTMVATLGATHDGGVGEPHSLALPYASTAAFGVSVEPASTVPTKPTKVVAVGTA